MKFLYNVLEFCANFRNYRSIRDLPLRSGLWYLTKLILPVTLLTLLTLLPAGLHRVDAVADWADRHLPPLTLRDGHLSSPVPQPFRTGVDDFLLILDTTATTPQPDTNFLQGVLLKSDSFVFWIGATNGPTPVFRTQNSSLHGFPDGTVNGDYLRQLFRSFLWVGGPLIWALLAAGSLLIILFHALIFAGFAAVMERGTSRALHFGQLLNIAIHAATPAILVNAAFLALQLEVINLWWLYLIVYGLYLIGGVAASREPIPQDLPGPDHSG